MSIYQKEFHGIDHVSADHPWKDEDSVPMIFPSRARVSNLHTVPMFRVFVCDKMVNPAEKLRGERVPRHGDGS